jgi:hypothetical protein
LLEFEHRGTYDAEILMRLYSDLPWDHSGRPSTDRLSAHQGYVAMARRRHFFERRDDGWRTMLRYRSAERMLELTSGKVDPATVLPGMLRAINLGEGLTHPELVRGRLSLQVREAPGGTIRSYRTFPGDRFKLVVQDEAQRARFVEHMPTKLGLRYRGEMRIETLLAFLRERYGIYVDRLPPGDGFGEATMIEREALRKNLTAFMNRLREVGFYRDLSDACISQTVTPRYTIAKTGSPEAVQGDTP